jgi:hypothetical protein
MHVIGFYGAVSISSELPIIIQFGPFYRNKLSRFEKWQDLALEETFSGENFSKPATTTTRAEN